MKSARVYWDAEHGWTIDTPVALSYPAALRVCAFVKNVQSERLISKVGDAREQAQSALRDLSPKTLHQNLIGPSRTERVLYTE